MEPWFKKNKFVEKTCGFVQHNGADRRSVTINGERREFACFKLKKSILTGDVIGNSDSSKQEELLLIGGPDLIKKGAIMKKMVISDERRGTCAYYFYPHKNDEGFSEKKEFFLYSLSPFLKTLVIIRENFKKGIIKNNERYIEKCLSLFLCPGSVARSYSKGFDNFFHKLELKDEALEQESKKCIAVAVLDDLYFPRPNVIIISKKGKRGNTIPVLQFMNSCTGQVGPENLLYFDSIKSCAFNDEGTQIIIWNKKRFYYLYPIAHLGDNPAEWLLPDVPCYFYK